MDNIFEDVIKDCKDKHFHIFEYRCEYEIKFEHASSDELLYFTKTNYSHPNPIDCTKKLVNKKKMDTNSMK